MTREVMSDTCWSWKVTATDQRESKTREGEKADGKKTEKTMNMYCVSGTLMEWSWMKWFRSTSRTADDTGRSWNAFSMSPFFFCMHILISLSYFLAVLNFLILAPCKCRHAVPRYSWIFAHIKATLQSSLLWRWPLQSALKVIYITPKRGEDK